MAADEHRIDELLTDGLSDPKLTDGLPERIERLLPEGPPRPVLGISAYIAMAAAAVVFMVATVFFNSPLELFRSPSRLTASIMIANFGAMLIATGFLGWVAETADFEDSFVGMAIQSLARHPALRLGVRVAYAAAVVVALVWVLRPGSALVSAVYLLGPSHGHAVGTLGVIILCGLCLAAVSRLADSAEARLQRGRLLRGFALVVIVASCVVHYAILSF